MNKLLDRRSAMRAGLFAATGLGFLTPHGEASAETESQNKAVVGRWFTEFWGKTYNPAIVDALASPDMLLKYSLHEPRHGRENIKVFMTGFRAAFPDLNFWGTAPLIAEGDYVVGQWEGGGTHTGPAFSDYLYGVIAIGDGAKDAFHRHDCAQAERRPNP